MIERTKRAIVERLGINRIAAHADRLDAELQDLRALRDQLADEVERQRVELRELEDDQEHFSAWSRILVASEWAASAPLQHEPAISIVLPTRNRSGMLRDAIDSVLAQTYANWQLVIVDDGSTDDTPALLTELDDHRVITTRTDGIGASAARNHGLALASGDYVTFLDDDNLMTPGWLRAVAEHIGRHPDCDLIYGAQVRDTEPDERHLHGRRAADGLHLLFVDPFDERRLRNLNFIDLGVVVVRREHPELHFDEQLDIYIDWELIVRLASSTTPHPLPVLASIYRTSAEARISSSSVRHERIVEMQRRFAVRDEE